VEEDEDEEEDGGEKKAAKDWSAGEREPGEREWIFFHEGASLLKVDLHKRA
jgi:hypothetical protein